MKEIPLTNGGFTQVDDDKLERLSQITWSLNGSGYVQGYVNGTTTMMHRVVLDLQPGDPRKGDHIDWNPRNNQLSNLRIVNSSESMGHTRKQSGTTSKHKGVNWHIRVRKWQALGYDANGKRLYLGSFDCEDCAGRAYDAWARWYFGEYAVCNFPIVK